MSENPSPPRPPEKTEPVTAASFDCLRNKRISVDVQIDGVGTFQMVSLTAAEHKAWLDRVDKEPDREMQDCVSIQMGLRVEGRLLFAEGDVLKIAQWPILVRQHLARTFIDVNGWGAGSEALLKNLSQTLASNSS